MNNRHLTFHTDGTFKMVQFTDIHLQDGIEPERDARTLALMQRILETEQPDLVVFSGDLIYSVDTVDPKATFRRVIEVAVQAGTPFAVIYGNHDTEKGVTRAELQAILTEYELCVAEAGPEEIHGTGNYALPLYSHAGDRESAVLYFVDSGEYAPAAIGGYAWIHPNQVEWYSRESAKIRERNGGILPALAFMHIPIPEYNEVWQSGRVAGRKGEMVCCSKVNSGWFAAMLEAGDVMAAFAGHDHDNDYIGVLHGITLAYGRVTGHNTYGALQRGARVIQLLEGERRFETWIRLEDGSVM
ncbi:metallophosphoesterase [Paenibacillus helianthi]|uniref:Metallophosphoesterase n=1 Tax=Paenibacillus helianthi TaxID=1349432 RepID=A0ABX3EEH9_9BACL|nr:metallophosphoesterase family protein [Paenibacillus helianthi]OKP77611.1 metallophosphoesterase [Paenibacillus helianthi]